jgi:site-specific recombinase XerD
VTDDLRHHVPTEVRAALDRTTGSVLVDTTQLTAAHDRYDQHQAEALTRYLGTSQSTNTVRAYKADWHTWLHWCTTHHHTALPADPLDIAVYLATLADTLNPDNTWHYQPATLDRKAAAIGAIHAAAGLPSPTRTDVVRLTLRGIRRARNTRPHRKRPVLLHTLTDMLNHRPHDGWPTGITRRRDTLLLLTGFAGALRRTELAAITLHDLTVDTDHHTGEPVLLINLNTTKTDPTGNTGQRIALPSGAQPDTCPICALADWLDTLTTHHQHGVQGLREQLINPPPPRTTHRCHDYRPTTHDNHQPLFPRIDRHGHIHPTAISGRAVGELVKRYAQRAGLDPTAFAGHSLRAGFATQAALGGASDREIMRQGRWSNPTTVHRYIRTANPLEDNAVTRLGL